jgi:hypothetical protein
MLSCGGSGSYYFMSLFNSYGEYSLQEKKINAPRKTKVFL